MTHRFPIKEIAAQSGLSTATIDRVINKRAHVSPQTKARVAAAIAELEAQEAQLSARGRRMFFDIVIEAPERFSREVRRATEAILGEIGPAVCRPRFMTQEIMTEAEVLDVLARIAKRGSHGVCLKARDLPGIRAAVDGLVAAGIPVVTLVTDIQATQRIAYVGLDNATAGRTAAYLVRTALGDRKGSVLAIRSNEQFLGEEERARAFRDSLARLCPELSIVDASGGSGVHYQTSRLLESVVGALDGLRAVYSMGGGNRAILEALAHHRLKADLFIAHDLDRDNRSLLQDGSIDFVLHHDLGADMSSVFRAFLHHHRLSPALPTTLVSQVQIITPENLPPEARRF